MKRHAVAFAVVMLTLPLARPHAADVPRPNIVFFLVDDMGWQETSVPFQTRPPR